MPSWRSTRTARFLAIRAETFANVGAYLSYFSLLIPTMAGFRLLTGAYRIPGGAMCMCARSITNTVWVDAYRGAGRPECAYILERLVDAAARETGLAPRRNPAAQFRAALGDAVQDADDRRL